ncbi:tetratricopeptide repeat protein [Daejeonella oryzae]|uniref:tetratricopeptide repeat protein n=1 Tax=Daejeonella oryzae TaxID=1122943 RepID=UPI00042336B1|nr:tetratricopeptide repeat protein [Daejeonella oryzae]
MIKGFILIFLLGASATYCIAQHNKAKSAAIIVTGKVLSQADSNLVKELFFDGLHEKIVNNFQRASTNFNKVLEIDPANDAAMYELANIYHTQNQEADAERLIRMAVTVQPENNWYWLLLADIYKQTQNMAQLVPVFDELIRLSPANEDNYFDKANALLMQNKVNEATAVYNSIEKLYGSSEDLSNARQRILIQQGKPGKAAAELEKLVISNPSDLGNYLSLSEIYAKSGKRDQAIAVLQKAALADPANALVRLSLADHYRALNKPDDAFIELKVAFADPNLNIDDKVRIILSFFPQFADYKARAYADELASITAKTHPDDPKAFSVYGDVLYQEQKYSEAKEEYKKALVLNDQVYQIWEQVLRIDITESKFKDAITDGEAALAIFPNQAPLYLFSSIAYAQSGNHEKAIAYLKNAADLETENKDVISQIFSGMGDSYNALKRYSESDQAYEKALAADPDNSYTLNNYAYYLSLRGENLEKAAKMSKRSIELDPGNSSSEDTYAWILFRLKKYADALIWIEKAMISGKVVNAVQLEHYGDILFFLGNKEQALLQWTKARQAGSASEKLNQKINEKKYIE